MSTYPIDRLNSLNQVAQNLLLKLKPGDIIFLSGDLGSGKTTFTQMLLRQAGYQGHIKSPTYTLYEHYSIGSNSYYHMDLYRISDPEELYYLAIEDILDGTHIVLIEWPEKGQNALPSPTYHLQFSFNGKQRSLTIT